MISNEPIHSNTDKVIIFPYNISQGKFETKDYKVSQTNQRASKDDISDVLGEVENAIKSKMHESDKIMNYVVVYSFIVLGGGTMFSASKGWLKDANKSVKMSILELALIAPAIWYGVNFSIEKTNEIKTMADIIFDRHNTVWSQKGLRWNAPKAFPKWVELSKEYKIQQFKNEQD